MWSLSPRVNPLILADTLRLRRHCANTSRFRSRAFHGRVRVLISESGQAVSSEFIASASPALTSSIVRRNIPAPSQIFQGFSCVEVQIPSSAEQFAVAAQAFLQNFLGSLGVPPDSEFARSLQSVGVDSAKFAALQASYFQLHAALWQSTLTREAGRDATPVAPPERSDRRFSSAEWQRI